MKTHNDNQNSGEPIQATNSKIDTAPLSVFDASGLIALVSSYEELTRLRIKFSNRLSAIERAGGDNDALAEQVDRMEHDEKRLARVIEKQVKQHPLSSWAKGVKGLGLLSFGVVLAHLGGDVLIASPKGWETGEGKRKDGERVERELVYYAPHERTVAQLRAYCGYGDPSRGRRGVRRADDRQAELFAGGVPVLKARLHLIAESFLKSSNETYRPMYDEAKAKYRREHEDWSDGRCHNAALRFVVKSFLRDLWVAAHASRESSGDTNSNETTTPSALDEAVAAS